MDVPQPNSGQQPAQSRPKRTPSLLSWWAILPTLLWGFIACKYVWPLASRHASMPKYAASYFIGQLIAAPLGGLIVGWSLYRLCNRSPLAGTIGYSVVCLAMSFNQFQESRAEFQVARAGEVDSMDATSISESFPAYGVALQTPPGWRHIDAHEPGIIARWVSPGSTPADLRGLIQVEVTQPTPIDGKKVAQLYANQWNGKIVDDAIMLDGEKAWQIKAQPLPGKLQPTVGVVCVHQARLYLIDAGVTQGQTCQRQVDFIRKSWRWIPVESPINH